MSNYAPRLSDDEMGRYRQMAQWAREEEADLWKLAGIVPGAQVVDVGCGPGATLVAMAEVVGAEGSVTGVDADPDAVDRARVIIDAAGVAAQARAQVGQADATGLAPESCDVAVLRHVLAHNGGREQAIVDHLSALVRPGGCVYLVDVDVDMMDIRPAVPGLTELLGRYHEWHRIQGNDLRVGTRLADLMRVAGLEVVEHRDRHRTMPWPVGMRGPSWAARESLVAAGLATPGDIDRWDKAFTHVDAAQDRPTVVVGGFVGIGRRSLPRSARHS